MLKTFIFFESGNKWVEEQSHLLYHDLCAFVDEDNHVIFLWNGPQSTKERLKKGTESINQILKDYPSINFVAKPLDKNAPPNIKNLLEKLLEAVKKEQEVESYQFSHLSTIRFHLVLSVILLILPIITFAILASSLLWESLGNNILISSSNYNNWLLYANILLIISLIISIPIVAIAIYEYDIPIIVFSSTSIFILILLILYLQQGIFLFQFQELSTSSLYYIAKTDLYIFLIIIGFAIALFEVPNIFNTANFLITYKKFIF